MEKLFAKWKTFFELQDFNLSEESDVDLQSFHALTYLISMEYKSIKKKYTEMKCSLGSQISSSLLTNTSVDGTESPDLFGNNNLSLAQTSPIHDNTDIIVVDETDIESSPTIVRKSKKVKMRKCAMELQFSPRVQNNLNTQSTLINRKALKQKVDLNTTSLIPCTPNENIKTSTKKNRPKIMYISKKPALNTLTQVFKNMNDNVILNKDCIKNEPISNSKVETDCDETFFIPEKHLLAKSGSSFRLIDSDKKRKTPPTFKDHSKNKPTKSKLSSASTRNESTFLAPTNLPKNNDSSTMSESDQGDENVSENKYEEEFDSYNMIPERPKSKSPDYVYKENAPRKKADKLKLKGWNCPDCEHFYANRPELSASQLQELKNKCSKHKSKFQPRANTPQGFWNPCFGSQFSEND